MLFRSYQHVRLVPPNALHAQWNAVALRVRAQERDRVVGPVRREHVRAAERSGERRQAEARAELDHSLATDAQRGHDRCQRNAARPELRPVGQELILVEGVLVDQLVGVRRPQQRDGAARELEPLFDQRPA